MSFPKCLNLAQGVMIHESMACSMIPPPVMGDSSASQKFQAAIENRMAGVWDMMFPMTGQINQQEEEAALKAAERFRRQRETGTWSL